MKKNEAFIKVCKMIGLSRDLNPGPLAPKARIIPLDHWAIWMLELTAPALANSQRNEGEKRMQNVYGSGGIRTHASEETGALNQRLRPLGHATH